MQIHPLAKELPHRTPLFSLIRHINPEFPDMTFKFHCASLLLSHATLCVNSTSMIPRDLTSSIIIRLLLRHPNPSVSNAPCPGD